MLGLQGTSMCSRRVSIGALGTLGPEYSSIATQIEGGFALHWLEWHLGRVVACWMDGNGDHSCV